MPCWSARKGTAARPLLTATVRIARDELPQCRNGRHLTQTTARFRTHDQPHAMGLSNRIRILLTRDNGANF